MRNPSIFSNFYYQLLKSDLSLSQRSHCRDLVVSILQSQSSNWPDISSKFQQYIKPLSILRSRGFVPFEHPLCSTIAKDLADYSCRGRYKELNSQSLSDVLSNVTTNQNVKALLDDRNILDFVSLYLGAPALIDKVVAWWQHPSDNEKYKCNNQQLWHRDRDDFSSLKLFIYCSDVDANSGPHAFLPGSHDFNKIDSIFDSSLPSFPYADGSKHGFFSDEQLSSFLLKSHSFKPHIFVGSSGFSFFEDTKGFHRAYPPISNSRLVFAVSFTVVSRSL